MNRESEERGDRQSVERDEAVEDMRTARRFVVDSEGHATDFEGQGAQMGADEREAQGTGYTNDRTERLREDNAMSGSQGRQGRGGNRQGARRIKRTQPERGPNRQNAPDRNQDSQETFDEDVDRTVM
jgi:hypothetical protein